MLLECCKKCSKEFKKKPSQKKLFCSRTCWLIFCAENRTYQCTFCQNHFQIKPESKRKRGKPFCSSLCFNQYQTGENNSAWQGVKEYRLCATCNQTFIITTMQRKKIAKFCSIKCRTIFYSKNGHPRDRKIVIKCKICDQEIKADPNRQFCGSICSSKNHSFYIRGENNGRYIHGEYQTLYPPGWTNSYKKIIRERDNNQCKLCGLLQINHGLKLHVHHIDHNKDNINIKNLITLCKYCHRQMHGRNVRDQCKERLLKILEKSP